MDLGLGFERGTQQMRLHYGQMFAASPSPQTHRHTQTNTAAPRVVCAFMAAEV